MKNILALLADWANGLFALLLALTITETELEWWFIPVAILLSHLPDVDAVPELLRRGRVSASAVSEVDHRTFLHYPIFALVFCSIMILYGGFWGLVIAIVIPLHLLNDLYGTGWGLQLFWPVSQTRFKLFGRKVNRLRRILVEDEDWDGLSVDDKKLRIVVKWRQEEFPIYLQRWGVDLWIERWYGRINWVSGVEYFLFALACGLFVVKYVT